MSDGKWYNVFHEEVNIEEIDREYALNILTMYMTNKVWREGLFAGIHVAQPESPGKLGAAVAGEGRPTWREDPLYNRLRDRILSAPKRRRPRDVFRAIRYNVRCRYHKLPYRARVL